MLTAIPCYSQTEENTHVILNNQYKGDIALRFFNGAPCLTRPLLAEWGLTRPLMKNADWTAQGCLSAASMTSLGIQFWSKPAGRLLTLLIPHEAMHPQQQGISTSRWDEGITAGWINYRLSANHETHRRDPTDNGSAATLEMDNGVNIGPWRLRYQNTFWKENQGDHGSYSREKTLYRSFSAWRSRLTVGDGDSSSHLFASLPYRGVSLASDEAMFPDSWRPFSPWINGYARGPSEVSLYQNGDRVYQQQVPAGPFSIRDFYPPGAEGNLELVITDSDGTERRRTLPYSSMPNLVQRGNFSYETLIGHYRPYRGADLAKPAFAQGSLAYGIAQGYTLFAGIQSANTYRSQVLGISRSLQSWGAISVDISHAQYRSGQAQLQGEVARLRYVKAFFNSETSLSALLLHYPRGSLYRSFAEKIERDSTLAWLDEDENVQRSWGSEVLLNQILGEDASASLSWNQTQYHHKTTYSSLTLSHNMTLQHIDVSLYASYQRSRWVSEETVVGINLSVPLDIGDNSINVGYSNRLASRDLNSNGLNVSGSALQDYRLHYALDVQHTTHGDEYLSAGMGYQANSADTTFNYYQGGGTRRWQADASGSIVLHAEGITLGQTLGETASLVVIPDTPSVGTFNQFGSVTDRQGRMLVSYATPWRVNRITVNTTDLPENWRFEPDVLEVVPTRGALVRTQFNPPQTRESLQRDD
ncbi:usher protein [Enterobacterales bacterium CwR94]|nr:usher protein [Enterobacterales bacterium CwR94]